jgi:streptogramin lyase
VTNEYQLPQGSAPGDIASGPDGRLWFVETATNQIRAITTGGSISTPFGPTGADPSAITASGGALWFTENVANQIGRVTTTGVITNEFPIPTAGSGPSGIAFGSDQALWFTESNANKIGRMTTSGSFTEFPVPSAAPEGPDGIAAGSDGALWFTEKGANKIGRIVPASSFVPPPPPPPLPVTPTAKASMLSLGVSPKAFRAAPRGSSISAKVGATVTYRLSAAATTRFTVERETVGRKKGRKCVRQTPRNRRAKRCKLYKLLRGSFSHRGKAGNNKFRFSGRVSAKRLRPGRYRLVAVVGSNKSSRKRANFRIVRR